MSRHTLQCSQSCSVAVPFIAGWLSWVNWKKVGSGEKESRGSGTGTPDRAPAEFIIGVGASLAGPSAPVEVAGSGGVGAARLESGDHGKRPPVLPHVVMLPAKVNVATCEARVGLLALAIPAIVGVVVVVAPVELWATPKARPSDPQA